MKAPGGAFIIVLRLTLAVGDVHGDFETETHFGVLRLGPHVNYLHKFG